MEENRYFTVAGVKAEIARITKLIYELPSEYEESLPGGVASQRGAARTALVNERALWESELGRLNTIAKEQNQQAED